MVAPVVFSNTAAEILHMAGTMVVVGLRMARNEGAAVVMAKTREARLFCIFGFFNVVHRSSAGQA